MAVPSITKTILQPRLPSPAQTRVVERSFGWLMHCGRLVRDHEQTAASAVAWIHFAFIRLMSRRLA